MLVELALFALAALATAAFTWLMRRVALMRGMLDIPNARSSHTQPTPRGGGVAIAIVVLATCILSALFGYLPAIDVAALAIGGGVVAAVGYYDDLKGLSVRHRFTVHALVSVLAVAVLIDFGPGTQPFPLLPRAVVFLLLVAGIMWSINLFNFMDGIDGIAGSEAAFVSTASAVLIVMSDHASLHWLALPVVTSGACFGFLIWNWPPARIFMGDAGSGFLGFWLASMAVALEGMGVLSIWTSAILGSVFIADATITLVRRILTGERWHEAHCSHAYQHLARRWGSHFKVTALVWGVNLAALLPLAYASTVWPAAAAWLASGTLLLLGGCCLAIGAGRPST